MVWLECEGVFELLSELEGVGGLYCVYVGL